jgi:Tol biopolymer transport system component
MWVIIPCMNSGSRLLRILVPLIILMLIFGASVVWVNLPRLVGVSPPINAVAVPAASPVIMSFSRPVKLDSVRLHFRSLPQRVGKFEVQDEEVFFTPDVPWPSGREITIYLDRGIRSQHGLSLPTLQDSTWSFTTSQTLLAYLWPSDGSADIYALDPLSGEIRQLTAQAGVIDFSVSWDGLAIYYSATNSEGGSDLFRLDLFALADGSAIELDPQIVMKCLKVLCSSPQISPDGKLLAYEQVALSESGQSSDIQVWLLSLEDSSQTLIGLAGHRNKNPSWSSLGILAAYNVTRQVYSFFDPGKQELSSFSNETGEPGSWHPDGGAYLVAEIMDVSPAAGQRIAPSHLLRYDLPTESIYDLTLTNDIEDAYPLYSPTGNLIAFARKYLDAENWTPGRQLWLMDEDGSEVRPLSDEPNYNHYDFAWSPERDQIAYLRFDQTSMNMPPELWLVDADGSEAIQLVIGGYNPRWIP